MKRCTLGSLQADTWLPPLVRCPAFCTACNSASCHVQQGHCSPMQECRDDCPVELLFVALKMAIFSKHGRTWLHSATVSLYALCRD